MLKKAFLYSSYAPANTMGHFSWRAPPSAATGTLPAAGLRQRAAGEGGGGDMGGTLAAPAGLPAGATPGWIAGEPRPRSGAAPGRPPSGLDFGNGGPSPAVNPERCQG